MKRIAFLFPGQGSQSVGMGKDFFESFPIARETFEEGDALLNYFLSRLLFEGPTEALMQTRSCQAGIYLNSMAILRVIRQQFPQLEPAVCAGLSLGEYTALTASERISFSDGIQLVQDRGEAMHAACEKKRGGMAAVFGLSVEGLKEALARASFPGEVWLANCNCPGQNVISGTVRGVEAGIQAAKERGAKRTIPLRVHGAFHSGLMQPAKEILEPRIRALQVQESRIGLVMNVPGDFVSNPETVKDHLIDQVTSPVHWEQGIRKMGEIDLFIEIGCGKTLAGMNKQIGVGELTVSIGEAADLEKLEGLCCSMER